LWLWSRSRHWIVEKPLRRDWSSTLFTLSLFAINRGEFFELYAIAKKRYRVETFRDAKKFLHGVSLRFALEKFG
jgi:hypothetical protein